MKKLFKKIWGITHVGLILIWNYILISYRFIRKQRHVFYVSITFGIVVFIYTVGQFTPIIEQQQKVIDEQKQQLLEQTQSVELMKSAFANAILKLNKPNEFDLNKVPSGVILWRSGNPDDLDSARFIDIDPPIYYGSNIVGIYNGNDNKVYEVIVPYYAMPMFYGEYFESNVDKRIQQYSNKNKSKKGS